MVVMRGDKDYQASADIDFADYMALAELILKAEAPPLQ